MIENRLRLEREVLKGRRAVRRTVLPREPIPPMDVDPGNAPDISMGGVPSPDNERGEVAWPMDTDTDTPAFKYNNKNGKLRLWPRMQDQQASGTSTPAELKDSQDPLRSAARRRRWTSQLLETGDGAAGIDGAKGHGLGDPDTAPEEYPAVNASTPERPGFMHLAHLPSGVLRSLRERSFGRLSSPFRSPHGKGKDSSSDQQEQPQQEPTWSSDSSELTDELDLPESDFRDESYAVRGPTLSSSREL